MSGTHTPIEVFYSYAHADKRWCQKLDSHLSLMRHQGLISTWYDRQIVPGTDWTQAIDTHLNSASVILLLISPAFMASDYCYGIEMKRALERQQANEARVIPILLRKVDWQGAPFGKLQALPTNIIPVTTWGNRDEAFADIAAGIRHVIEDLPLLSASIPRMALPPMWNIPYPRNSFFTGREDLLLQLHTEFQADQSAAVSQAQAISGLGGIGKTQIAVEYAYRYHQDYQAVFWARAENRETLTSSFVNISKLLCLPEKDAQDQTITVQAVKTWLQQHRQWLLILDNADDLTLVGKFLPSATGGHILLTTQAASTGRLAKHLEVDTLELEEGIAFLLRRAGILVANAPMKQISTYEQELAEKLVQDMGGLPLALDQAGAYIEETQCSMEDYFNQYGTRKTELLNKRGGLVDDHPKPVAATLSLSFMKVKWSNPAAADLLQLCAFLQPDAIPEQLLIEGAKHLGRSLQSVVTDLQSFNEAVKVLRTFSLIQRDSNEKVLRLHRLVQTIIKGQMSEGNRWKWAKRCICLLDSTFPSENILSSVQTKAEQWEWCEQLAPHVLVSAALTSEVLNRPWIPLPRSITTSLFRRVAHYLEERCQYREADVLYELALYLQEQASVPEDQSMNPGAYIVICPYCRHRQISGINKLRETFFPINNNTAINISYNIRDINDIFNNIGNISFYSIFFNALILVRMAFRWIKWVKKKIRFYLKKKKKQNPWLRVTCDKCGRGYKYNPKINDYKKISSNIPFA